MLKSWKKNIGFNIRELKADNQKSGSEKWANGKPRTMAQIIAISLSKATPMKKTQETKKENMMDKKLGAKEKKNEMSEYAPIRVVKRKK